VSADREGCKCLDVVGWKDEDDGCSVSMNRKKPNAVSRVPPSQGAGAGWVLIVFACRVALALYASKQKK